jgi:hypothetical protein
MKAKSKKKMTKINGPTLGGNEPPAHIVIRRDVSGRLYCSGFSWNYPVGDHHYKLVIMRKAKTEVGLLAKGFTKGKVRP